MMKRTSSVLVVEKTSSGQLKLQPSSESCIFLGRRRCKLEILLLHKAVVAKTREVKEKIPARRTSLVENQATRKCK